MSFHPLNLRSQSGEITIIIMMAIIAIALFFGGYKLVGYAANHLAEKVPDKVEAEWFSKLSAKSDSNGSTEPKTNDQKRAMKVFTKLKESKGLRELPYNLVFLPDAEPNAYALPGGTIAVSEGLLKMVHTEIGLATVLGHEFGHHQYRHSLKMMGRSLLVAGILMVTLGGDHGFILNSVLGLAENSHSRTDEYDADAFGIRMVFQAYNSTKDADEFFIKLEQDPDNIDLKALNFLSTHPYTPDRIEKLRAMMEQLEASNGR